MITKCERNGKGQFVTTNGGQRYKVKQKKGIRKGEHVLIWEEYYNSSVPNGHVIHHKDLNKKNNSIENLQCVSYLEHNRIHAHEAWNKGIKAPQISTAKLGHKVTKEQIQKAKITWFIKYLDCNIKIWKLRDQGLTFGEISKEVNLTKGQVIARWRGFTTVYLIPFGEVINE